MTKADTLEKVRGIFEQRRAAVADYEEARRELHDAIRAAADEFSCAELASVVGLTRQRIHQIVRERSLRITHGRA